MDIPGEGTGDGQILTNATEFIQNVSQFYNSEALSDVILKIGEQKYFAHKFVLAKSSPVFRTMLYERPWAQGLTNEVVLNETPECQAAFDRFLQYLYTASVAISVENAVGILCLADKYNIESLKELCMKYMLQNSSSPKVSNALNWFSWSKALHLEPVIEKCSQTITWNAQEVMSSQEWLDMDIDFVVDILSSSELVIPNEYVLFEGVQRYLFDEPKLCNIHANANLLLPLIRFPQMLVNQLYNVEQSQVFTHERCNVLLQNLLGKAYRFRTLALASHIPIDFKDNFYEPRDYTDLTVDTVGIQNTLRFGIQVDVKMFAGPVPSDKWEGEWKITYRRNSTNNELWTLQVYCHESAMVNKEAKFKVSMVIYDDNDKVIQVYHGETFTLVQQEKHTVQLEVNDTEKAYTMAVLIKPVVA